MSIRSFIEKERLDKLSPEDFSLILQLLDDDTISYKAFEALKILIERSSGIEAEMEAYNLIYYISGKPKGAALALKLLPTALTKAPRAAGIAFLVLSSLLDVEELREQAREVAMELARYFPNEAKLIRYKLYLVGGEDSKVKELGESTILTKGISLVDDSMNLSTPFITREVLRKLFRLFQIGPSYQFAEVVATAAVLQPDVTAEFLPEIIQLIDKYAASLPDLSLRLCDALELLLAKEKGVETYVLPLTQTIGKVKDERLRKRLEAIIKKYIK